MRYQEITESSNTITLYHGGRDLEFDHREMRGNKSAQFQHGVGLYLISDIAIAAKFAKGGNKLYKVEIERGRRSDQVIIPVDVCLEFAKKIWSTNKENRKDFLAYMHRGERETIPAEQFFNLILNFDFLTPSKSLKLRQFFVDQGVDYQVTKNYGGSSNTMVVVINPAVIRKVTPIRWADVPQDEYNPTVNV